MVNPVYLLVSSLVSLLVTLVCTRYWIPVARERGLVGRDMNKPGEVYVAEAGGVWVAVGSCFGLLVLVALYRYLEGEMYHVEEVFALSSVLMLAGFIGFLDDILGWKRGLPRWQRIVFMAPVALPLVVIKAGVSRMELPLLGVVNLGLLYPLAAVPVGVLGAANAFNIIAGYNGLEAGMGLLLMLFTAAYSLVKGIDLVFYASIVMASALAGFLAYNWYPARVFPGNSLTYAVGAYYASLIILGNFEKYGLALFTLYYIKFILYLRGELHGVWKTGVEDFAKPRPDGTLEPPLKGAYSLQHLTIRMLIKLKGTAREPEVVAAILAMQAAIGVLCLALALQGVL